MTGGGDARTPGRSPTKDALVFVLAMGLSGLAGFVDAAGFVGLGGVFVSFMAGDGTRAAIKATQDVAAALALARLILVFVLGVVAGETVGAATGRFGRVVVLAGEAALLWAAYAAVRAGAGDAIVTSLLGLAMGAQNASVHHTEGIDVALTYVTGMVVHIGRGIARALRGEPGWRKIAPLSALWAAVLLGSVAGGVIARHSIGDAVAVAAAAATAAVAASLVLLTAR